VERERCVELLHHRGVVVVRSSGLEGLRADAEDSAMALSSTLRSPYCSDFRPEVEHWARLLQQLGREQATLCRECAP